MTLFHLVSRYEGASRAGSYKAKILNKKTRKNKKIEYKVLKKKNIKNAWKIDDIKHEKKSKKIEQKVSRFFLFLFYFTITTLKAPAARLAVGGRKGTIFRVGRNKYRFFEKIFFISM